MVVWVLLEAEYLLNQPSPNMPFILSFSYLLFFPLFIFLSGHILNINGVLGVVDIYLSIYIVSYSCFFG